MTGTLHSPPKSITGIVSIWPTEWRWLPWMLVISMLMHMLILRHLDKNAWRITFPEKETRPIELQVQIKSLPRPKNEALLRQPKTNLPADNKTPASRQITASRLVRSPAEKAKTAIPAKALEESIQPPSPRPQLNLSKILEDARDVAKEAEEHANGQQFDRRKLELNPENIKAPELKRQEEIDNYKTAEGETRVCRSGLDGKKHCMRAPPEQAFRPINESFFVMEQDAREKTPGELLGERLKKVIKPH